MRPAAASTFALRRAPGRPAAAAALAIFFAADGELRADPRARAVLTQQAWRAEGVERLDRDTAGCRRAEQRGQPLRHLPGGLVGEGDGQDRLRRHAVLQDQVRDATVSVRVLPVPGPADDQQQRSAQRTRPRCSSLRPPSSAATGTVKPWRQVGQACLARARARPASCRKPHGAAIRTAARSDQSASPWLLPHPGMPDAVSARWVASVTLNLGQKLAWRPGRPRPRRETPGSRRTRRRSRPGRRTSPRRMRPMPSASRSPPARRDLVQRRVAQDGQLRPEPRQQLLHLLLHLLRACADAVDLAQHLRQRDQAVKGMRPRRSHAHGPVGQLLDAVHHADGDRLAADRADRRRARSVVGGSQTMPQARWPSRWYLPSSGKNSTVPQVASPGSPVCAARRKMRRRSDSSVVEQRRLARPASPASAHRSWRPGCSDRGCDTRQFIGGSDERPVSSAKMCGVRSPKHSADRVEAGFRAEQREPRRPDVRGDQVAGGVGLEDDLEQVARVEAEDGAAVGADVADLLQPGLQPLRPPRTTAQRRRCGPCAVRPPRL